MYLKDRASALVSNQAHREPLNTLETMDDIDLLALHEAAEILDQHGYHDISVQVFAVAEREG